MQRISSNFTIIYKIFLPTLWISFFGLFSIALFFRSSEELDILSTIEFKIIFAICFLVFLILLYFTVINLKRVELDEEYFYVSNYFKTYRYRYEDIEKIVESDFLLFHMLKIHLRKKGKLGKKLPVLLAKKLYQNFIEKHPERFEHLLSRSSK